MGIWVSDKNNLVLRAFSFLPFCKMSLQLPTNVYYCKSLSVKEIPFAKIELHIDIKREEEQKKAKQPEEPQEKANTHLRHKNEKYYGEVILRSL